MGQPTFPCSRLPCTCLSLYVHKISMALVLVCKGGSSAIYSLGTSAFTQQLFWQHKTTTVVLPGGKYSSQHAESCGHFGSEQVGHRLVYRWRQWVGRPRQWGRSGHRAKASAKISRERERAAHGTQNKICSIPSVSTLFQKMTY